MARKRLDEFSPDSPYQTQTPVMQVTSVEPDVPLVNQSPLLSSSVVTDRRDVQVDPPKRYILRDGGMFTINGFRTRMTAGKVLDEANYNIASLRSQGAVLLDAES